MNKIFRILAINPGSTSTKIALYENEQMVFQQALRHSSETIAQFKTIYDQLEFRMDLILDILRENSIDPATLDAVVGRGGNMKPVRGGTYQVNTPMLEDLKIGVMGQHASNLGGIIAHRIAQSIDSENVPAYVVDPVVVDEFEEFARLSGMPEIQRKAKDHPLNQKAVARRAAKELGGTYDQFNFLVTHMGGGISIGVHKKGRIVDVNNCLDGDGPFSPERSGGLPVGSLIDLCFSGVYTKEEIRRKIVGQGGLVAYLGTNSGEEVQKRIKAGDAYAELVYKTMAYQVAKEIGAGAAVLGGHVDAIILTGGLAYDKEFIGWITERVGFISSVMVFPGEYEMIALAEGVLRVIRGQEIAQEYN